MKVEDTSLTKTTSEARWTGVRALQQFVSHRNSVRDKPICHLVFHREVRFAQGVVRRCQIYLAQNGGEPAGGNFKTFITHHAIKYKAFRDDFGPMNLLSIMHFIDVLDQEIEAAVVGNMKVVYSADIGQRALTNAAFLLGSYMILKLGERPEDVLHCFRGLGQTLLDPTKACFEPYCDASDKPTTFGLELVDCWRGLARGIGMGWLHLPTPSCPDWGLIIPEEYRQYDNVLNGDLHEVVPRKFIVFKGPVDLGPGVEYRDNPDEGTRDFSPGYYVDVFKPFNVVAVVRLNEVRYDKREFEKAGMRHEDLFFEDCTAPSPEVIARFFQIVDATAPDEAVAIHCKAGIGRTGTLVALYLMHSAGFSAREAMGWLRIMRPGSVLGEQQQFLCNVEANLRELAGHDTPWVLKRASSAHGWG